eukprot:GFUD01110812.1.p1 GENE.GFUD01110812.1~~GFUD01110812.1.p1  ORF type:complete len:191 (+),score=43.69 GFUD01110812.1:149-721(+)
MELHHQGVDYWEDHELEEMAAKLVCYQVKGFKKGEAKKAVSANLPIPPVWRNKTGKQMWRDKIIRQQLEKAINTGLRQAVLKEMFPAASGLANKAENSIGKFDNNVGYTIKYCGGIHGSANINVAVTQDGGEIVLQNLWITFLGQWVKKRERGISARSVPFFHENEEEVVFKITYMNVSNDKFCKIDMPG